MNYSNFYSLPNLFILLSFLLVGLIIFYRGPNNAATRSWFILSIVIAAWSCSVYLSKFDSQPEYLKSIYKLTYLLAIPWISIFYYRFLAILLDFRWKNLLIFLYIFGIYFSLLILAEETFRKLSLIAFLPPLVIRKTLFAFWIVIFLHSIIVLATKFQKSDENTRNQLLVLLLSTIIGLICGTMNFFPIRFKYSLDIFNMFIVIIPFLICYSIIRFKFLEFNLVARMEFTYLFIVAGLIFVTIPFLIFLEWLGMHFANLTPGVSTLVAIIIIVAGNDWLKNMISKSVDTFVFQSSDFQLIIEEFNTLIKKSNGIDSMIRNLSDGLNRLWNVHHSGFIIWNYQTLSFDALPHESFDRQEVRQLIQKIEKSDYLIKTLETERRLFWNGLVTDKELEKLEKQSFPGEKITFAKIRRTMRWLGASICVPLMSKDELNGFIVLGSKKNHSEYNIEDKKILVHLSRIILHPLMEIYLAHYTHHKYKGGN